MIYEGDNHTIPPNLIQFGGGIATIAFPDWLTLTHKFGEAAAYTGSFREVASFPEDFTQFLP